MNIITLYFLILLGAIIVMSIAVIWYVRWESDKLINITTRLDYEMDGLIAWNVEYGTMNLLELKIYLKTKLDEAVKNEDYHLAQKYQQKIYQIDGIINQVQKYKQSK